MLNKKITFIGGGNMAEGIIRGLISNEIFSQKNIAVFDILSERRKYLNVTYGIVETEDVTVAVKDADIILIAVLPQNIVSVAQNIKEHLSESTIIISICAGIKMEKLENLFESHHKLVRIMPNTMIDVQHGYSAANVNEQVQLEDKKIVETLLSALGQTMFIDENLFNSFTAYSCAGPAYIMYFLAALIDSGVESGFSRKDATAIALENLIASALTIQKTGKHPYQITDTMTSPAGTTIAGLHVLSKSSFHGTIMSSVKSALERTNELE
ncbi:pyrroline-5-carboxylate reductase [Clostridium estertheticum]|uniref:pyrroline-5-carboxylate reductase n=1 Tax=Clostridium estertheticum TaxID=238834 RepID=UPI001CF2B0CB|nr:pyrroline-5-carboxylate reductase [Clostridium estertheticum]MCB2338980.1 pyrroline-5-carboxylate reductase [Clostridium estertheticum]